MNDSHPLTSTTDSHSMTDELYLSRLTLNLRSRHVQADLANSQGMHTRLLTAFPHYGGRAAFSVLYRIEPAGDRRPDTVTGLVQSSILPDWTKLPLDYLAVPAIDWFDQGAGDLDVEAKRVDTAYRGISSGQLLRFRLRANPTRKIHIKPGDPRGGKPTGKNGARVPLHDERLPKWLADKGERHGFRVLEVRHQPDPVSGGEQRGYKGISDSSGNDAAEPVTKAARQTLVHNAVLFDGVLHVTDADLFHLALWQGIGSAKAYGFGLLSIAGIGGR